MTHRPERGTAAHLEWVADWLRRCADEIEKPPHKVQRDEFRAWASKLPDNDNRPRKDDFSRIREARRLLARERDRAQRPHNRAEVVCVVSDIHFDLHDVAAWAAFREWHADVRPDRTVVLGDALDLGMLSKYPQGQNDPLYAIQQIRVFVDEMNALAMECGRLTIVKGNHCERWQKALLGLTPAVYKGAIGLTLEEQCHAQGLVDVVEWVTEDATVRGVQCGPFVLRHGHQQSGRFGGGKHLAATRIAKSLGQSEVFGHHHRAQLFCQTAHGKTAIAIANPCMTRPHNYAPDADWQVGWTCLQIYDNFATPYILLVQDGRVAYGGKVYGAAL